MSEPLQVSLESMTQYARMADELSQQFGELRRTLVDADVAEDSFGMLPESREVAGSYAQRCSDGLDVLRDGERVFSEIDAAFRDMRDNYQSADDAGADIFEVPE